MGKLVLFLPDGTAQDIKLDRERIVIGRRPDNDVCIPQAPVSGEHAAVVTILDDSFLEDLGSTNGTLVNGKPITKHFLHDRDEIDIGREILVYLDDVAAKVAAPARRPERPRGAPKAGSAATSPGERDVRRPEGLMAISGQAVDAIQRVVAAEIESATSEPLAGAPPAAEAPRVPAPAVQPPVATQSIRVLTGSSSGRVMALSGSETVIGRAGIQVAALRRIADDIVVVPIEGATPPNINGSPVATDGQRLIVGDTLEIAGSTLELFLSADVAR